MHYRPMTYSGNPLDDRGLPCAIVMTQNKF